ncbi:type I secretion C-terminal target domain-containing protein [Vibrio vulnificus]|uniref:type I secretion C-terminal target domain-containing protein n=1 Tax=Vibrio vulnificus TaxID=672 RepID=UPI001EEA831D|nr:type I secretion C-terminal target domain-containing protein [Vibrio vulnificus]MCG6288889.1 type I secretion C-terminal target domain-containing protein [Vibrio vulnificus]
MRRSIPSQGSICLPTATLFDLSAILSGLGVSDGASADQFVDLVQTGADLHINIKTDGVNAVQTIVLSDLNLEDYYGAGLTEAQVLSANDR